VQQLLAKNVPTFGICLGHQLLALAMGLPVEKMPFGHHGGNHPVKDVELNTITITSQNHGYCVQYPDEASLLSQEITITHINLNDQTIEGIRHNRLPAFSVQFHPEAAPGPHDSVYLFDRFLQHCQQVNANSKKAEAPSLVGC
jgi:carbamoyl-phosphate synthase small subunit